MRPATSAAGPCIGIAAVMIALCCAVVPLAGAARAGGLAFGAGRLGLVAGLILVALMRASTEARCAQQGRRPLADRGGPQPRPGRVWPGTACASTAPFLASCSDVRMRGADAV
jgi:hypothetical protein